jgi:hypothetical protein
MEYASPGHLAEQGRNMELLCPNCQKKLTVPEQYAGQLMRCPLCQGTFTVPAVPSTAAAEAAEPIGFFTPPAKPETSGISAESPAAAAPTLPPISSETPSAATGAASPSAASAPPSTPAAGYSRVCTMKFNPQVVQWLPLGLVLAFFLTFFPWIGATVGSVSISINAWGLGFGDSKSVLFIFFDLLTVFAALLAIASLLFTLKMIPDVPALKPFLPLRSLLVGGVAGLAWFCLTLQYVILLLGHGSVPINIWGVLTWWIYTIATAGAFIEFWLEKRGPSKPAPRMSMEW